MRMYDIILKKRSGGELTREEIKFFIDNYVNGKIADYQVSALLMAIYFKGMSTQETSDLTMSMAESGEIIDLTSIPGIKVDKHSTGGVGDKTTLIVAPIVACLGVSVAKMSGRGLGYTGGTVDKLQSIPGFKTSLDRSDFFNIVKKIGVSLIGQSGDLVPADKKIYALRDVTATIDSTPLIASSIMSKKIASGADCIVLDVKCGNGAFMKTLEEALDLAKAMVSIGEKVNRKTIALITNMESPLGNAIGNSLEVAEACDVLKGRGPADLTQLSIALAANMLHVAGIGTVDLCTQRVTQVIHDGRAFAKLKEMVLAQGGDVVVLDDNKKFPQAKIVREILSDYDGYINSIDTEKCGMASMILGAGRQTKESNIDYTAGILLKKKVGDQVRKGETLALFHTSSEATYSTAAKLFKESLLIGNELVSNTTPVIFARVTDNTVKTYS